MKMEINELIDKFKNSLTKPHNYVRIAGGYLKHCIEKDLNVNTNSKAAFLENKAAVYKTALNKFFKVLGTDLDLQIYTNDNPKYIVDKDFYNELAKSTIETYNRILQSYFNEYGQSLDILDFDRFVLRSDNLTNETYNLNHSVLKKWFGFNNVLIKSKTKKVEQRKTRKQTLSESQLNTLFEYVVKNESKQLICMFGLMIYNALRSIDTIGFTKENNKYYSIVKGGANVEIQVNEKIKPYLDDYFTDRKSFEYKCTSSLRKHCKRLVLECLEIDFEKVAPHSFRHSFSLNETEKGTDFREIKKVLNHKSFDSTAHYTQDKY